ncbi:MAG: membrane protein insertion efficiency factor YidD [Candidatus Magasanikbacteria bacterium]|jgi:putative membrane protein insertion efficiency factor|nr:membrane protein insertion efficiency factor YidD [Candidatus Magasanikbacteria bacterium]
MKKSFFSFLRQAPKFFGIFFVWVYQKTCSPDHSFWAKWFFPHGYCPFYPSCSEYGKQSIEKYGLIRGIWKSAWRILRCHPWTRGGIDLP